MTSTRFHSPSLRTLLAGGCLLFLSGCQPDTLTSSGKPDGAKLYFLYCEGCHGPDGRKSGPEQDLTNALRMTDSQIRVLIKKGRGKMPPMGSYLKDEQIDALIPYVKQLSSSPPLPTSKAKHE